MRNKMSQCVPQPTIGTAAKDEHWQGRGGMVKQIRRLLQSSEQHKDRQEETLRFDVLAAEWAASKRPATVRSTASTAGGLAPLSRRVLRQHRGRAIECSPSQAFPPH